MTKERFIEDLKYKKISYNKLDNVLKQSIIDTYYKRKDLNFKQLSVLLNVSERAIARVLQENNINTKLKNRYTLNENYFEKIDNEQKAYILGLLYADGYVGDEKYNNVILSLTKKDAYMIQKIIELIEFTGNMREEENGGSFKNAKPKVILNFSSKKISTDLRAAGLYPGKSTTMKDLPLIDEKLYRHFVRGYFDGDGSITLSKKCSYHKVNGKIKVYTYPSYIMTMIGTKPFLEKIAKKMPISFFRINKSKSENMFYFRCDSKQDMPVLFNYLYDDATIYLKRKFDKWVKIMGDIDR